MLPITFTHILDFIGTFAFAISGIRMASSKNFDWFGAYVVGFVTAIGGGTLRDILLNVSPFWMQNLFFDAVEFIRFDKVTSIEKLGFKILSSGRIM